MTEFNYIILLYDIYGGRDFQGYHNMEDALADAEDLAMNSSTVERVIVLDTREATLAEF